MRAMQVRNSPKQTVSLTITSALITRAKALRINASQVAEAALALEVARIEAERAKVEVDQDLAACNAYTEQHGSFAAMVREHYGKTSG